MTIFIMTKKQNNPRKLLLNADVLSLSINEVEDILNLDSAPNVMHSDRTIVSHIVNASTSQTSINHVSNLCPDAPSEGTIRHRLRNLDFDETTKFE